MSNLFVTFPNNYNIRQMNFLFKYDLIFWDLSSNFGLESKIIAHLVAKGTYYQWLAWLVHKIFDFCVCNLNLNYLKARIKRNNTDAGIFLTLWTDLEYCGLVSNFCLCSFQRKEQKETEIELSALQIFWIWKMWIKLLGHEWLQRQKLNCREEVRTQRWILSGN